MATNTSISTVSMTQNLSLPAGKSFQAQTSGTQQESIGKPLPSEGKEMSKVEQTGNSVPGQDELEGMVAALNEVSESKPPHMKFSVDEDTGHTVVTMTQSDTGEVIRQIPSEEFFNIAKMILENTDSLVDQPGHFIEAEA